MVIESNIIESLNFKNIDEKFDIIFMDPPYKEKEISSILNKIFESHILTEYGIIIIHRHKTEKDVFPLNFKIVEEKIYGISRVIFGKLTLDK